MKSANSVLFNGLKLCLLCTIATCVIDGKTLDLDTPTQIGLYKGNPKSDNLYLVCIIDDDCTGSFEHCDTEYNRCKCQQNYQYGNDTNDCYQCPGESKRCRGCCSTDLQCYDGYCRRCYTEDGRPLCDSKAVIFVTASQIALSAALIMGVAALATLLYKICTKPNYFTSRYNRSERQSDSTFQRISRASLTSIQVRVLARLRDRPPKYETQHNYDTRIQQQQQLPPAEPIRPQICIVAGQAPPAYDGSRNSISEMPPAYSHTVETTTIPFDESTIGYTMQSSINSDSRRNISHSSHENESIKGNTIVNGSSDIDKSNHM